MSKAKVVVTMGDPAGIGPEIVVKSLSKDKVNELANIVVVGDVDVLEQANSVIKNNVKFNSIQEVSQANFENGVINVIDLDNIDVETFELGKVSPEGGQAAYEYIKKAHELCVNNAVDAMATTTINKESLNAAGISLLGHTAILKDLNQLDTDPLTMFEVDSLRVIFYSKHVSLKQATELITKEGIKEYVHLSHEALETMGVKNPKVAVAGLNPHNGEHGLFGDEEVNYIIPAIEEIQAEGEVDVYGPIGADSVFYQALNGKYDGVLSLYHDQGHIATKTYNHDLTISITHGLPYLRTSVDHGTAFDIAGTGIASEISLDEAVRLAALYAPNFKK